MLLSSPGSCYHLKDNYLLIQSTTGRRRQKKKETLSVPEPKPSVPSKSPANLSTWTDGAVNCTSLQMYSINTRAAKITGHWHPRFTRRLAMNAQLQPLLLRVHCNHSLKRYAWKTGRYHRGVSAESRDNKGIADLAISEPKQTKKARCTYWHAILRSVPVSEGRCSKTQTLTRKGMFTVNRG